MSGPLGRACCWSTSRPGPTSHDIVARVRRATGQRRVGHAGHARSAGLGPAPAGSRAGHAPGALPAALAQGLRGHAAARPDHPTPTTSPARCWPATTAPLPTATEVLRAAARAVGAAAPESARRLGAQGRRPAAVPSGRDGVSTCGAAPPRSRSSRFDLAARRSDPATLSISWPRSRPEPTSARWCGTWARALGCGGVAGVAAADRRSDRCVPDAAARPGGAGAAAAASRCARR